MKKIIKVITILLGVLIIAVAAVGLYVKKVLPGTGKATNLKINSTPELIARGKYLANHVAVCMDCHSQRDFSLFAGPVKPGTFGAGGEKFGKEMGFPGTIYSKNITAYSLNKWTDGEIFRAITTGVNKDGNALFPLMPYHAYGKMDKEDIYSIIAYLRTLPAIKSEVPATALDFPVNFLVNTMPAEASFTLKPPASDMIAYGGYIANAAGCIDCHSKFTGKGKMVAGTAFGGGRQFSFPGGLVTAPNISPDKQLGIGNWTKEQFISRFKMFTDPGYNPSKLSETDFNTPMPWNMYAGMSEQDLTALFSFLQNQKPLPHKVNKWVPKNEPQAFLLSK